MSDQINLTENLKKLSEIAAWFENQEQVDVEEGLIKVKEAATLIQESKQRLHAIQNEFVEIKKQIEETDGSDNVNGEINSQVFTGVDTESNDTDSSENSYPF